MRKYPKYYVPNDENWNKSLICIKHTLQIDGRVTVSHFYNKKTLSLPQRDCKINHLEKYIKKGKVKEIPECEAALLI